MLGKLLISFGIVGNFLLHDGIGDFFFFFVSLLAMDGYGGLVSIDAKVSQSPKPWSVIGLKPFACFCFAFVLRNVPDHGLERL